MEPNNPRQGFVILRIIIGNESDGDPPVPILSMSASSREESTSDLPETPATDESSTMNTAAWPNEEGLQAKSVRVRIILIEPSLRVVPGGLGDEHPVCFLYDGELVSIPYCAVVLITYTKETCGCNLNLCSFIDEYIAYILKHHPEDPNQISKADFRWMLNGPKVFKTYEYIVAKGGLMKVYPGELQPSIAEVLDGVVEIAQKWPWSRGLDDDEQLVVDAMNNSWIKWVSTENAWEPEMD